MDNKKCIHSNISMVALREIVLANIMNPLLMQSWSTEKLSLIALDY